MPPFSYLALFRAEAIDMRAPETFLGIVRDRAASILAAHGNQDVALLGPLPAPMERRNGKFRAQLLLQCPQRRTLQNLLCALCPELESMKESRSVRWSLDVDPQDMI